MYYFTPRKAGLLSRTNLRVGTRGLFPCGGCLVTHLSTNAQQNTGQHQKCAQTPTIFVHAPDAQSSRHLITGVARYHRRGNVNKCPPPLPKSWLCSRGLTFNGIAQLLHLALGKLVLSFTQWLNDFAILLVRLSLAPTASQRRKKKRKWLFSALTSSEPEHSKQLI